MQFSTSVSASLLSFSLMVAPTIAAPIELISTADTHLLLTVYSSDAYGGTKTTFSGMYSTCYGIPDEFQTKIKSLKLEDEVKSCHLYKQGGCSKPGGQVIYREDEEDVSLNKVLSVECFHGNNA
ncbi:hypothetical protein BKA64DRAFT_679334 [Cadophora sp. MPI-SDFR-AT-0126]|nr:hypothetical protein BKA64DRAFT_679334 [Leotiomycetes sp. MPI-SDFR-AT-0126]